MPISDLGQDILWEVFVMNADMDAVLDLGGLYEPGKEPPRYRYSPLTITRRTSQVCRAWRRLILESSSIWGRIIHLDFFDQEKDNWRFEVMQRTGQAPLCLKGDLIVQKTEDFFLDLLETDWHRIRRIDVRLHSEYVFEDEVWEPLLRPAPALESFNLGYTYYRALSLPRGKLFADKAPLLREFYATGIPFNLNSRWALQLQHITLSAPFSLPEILRAMKEMHALKSVRLESGVRTLSEITDDIRDLSLPQLRNIVLTGYLSTCLRFLECITPAQGCGLSLNPTRDTSTGPELDRAIRIFDRYSHNYFSTYKPKRLQLGITSSSFYIYDLLDPIRVPSSPSFKFTVRVGDSLAANANGRFLRSLMQSTLMDLDYLELSVYPTAIEPSDPDFVAFTSALSSLRTLQIDSLDALHPLQQIPVAPPIPFPALRTLKIVESAKLSATLVEQFLLWRKKCGKPIKLLDLTFCSIQLFGNLAYLEQFKGMKVRWSEQFATDEYVCGSGHRYKLDFEIAISTERNSGVVEDREIQIGKVTLTKSTQSDSQGTY